MAAQQKRSEQDSPASSAIITNLDTIWKSNTINLSVKIRLYDLLSLGATCKSKRSAVNDFILSNDIDILCVTETWFKESGDEPKLRDLAPAGYTTKSFPRLTTTCGGGIAFVITDKLLHYCSFDSTFVFQHQTFELVHLKLSLPCSPVTNFFRDLQTSTQ
ncbi:hypothetical protein ACOMHN_022198 [Nucella lapillus]